MVSQQLMGGLVIPVSDGDCCDMGWHVYRVSGTGDCWIAILPILSLPWPTIRDQ